MNKLEKEKREAEVMEIGEKTEEGRLKIEKIKSHKDNSYAYKITSFYWAAFMVLESLIRVSAYLTSSEKNLSKLVPISVVPLIIYLYEKLHEDRKAYKLEEEILNSKVK